MENTERMIRIAVITPMKNAEATIQRALKSVDDQNQSYDMVHYLIDDGCDDATLEKIDEYKKMTSDGRENYAIILRTSVYSGQSGARNTAINDISLDDFDYVAFLDADDWWEPHHLECAIGELVNGNSDFVCGIPELVDTNGNKVSPIGIPVGQEPNVYNIFKSNSLYISTVVMRTSVIQVVGDFDSRLDCIEDWDYWIRVLLAGISIKLTLNQTAHYTVDPNSMSGKVTPEKLSLLKSKHRDACNVEIVKHLMRQPVPIRLNLGCGDERIPGFINCDLYEDKADMQFDAKAIPFPDNSVDEIRAYHILEHFKFKEAWRVLEEWKRVLKPGGRFVQETPDLLNTCRKFVESDEQVRVMLYGHFFAWPDISPGQVHYFLYTETQLKWTLEQAGFERIERMYPDSTYATANPQWPELYLKTEAYKPYGQ